MIAIAWAVSEDRRKVAWRPVAVALGLQFALALLLLRVPVVWRGLMLLNSGVEALSDATLAGTAFVFGYVGGGPAPFTVIDSASSFILGLQALPLILVISALSALLWHWRILPLIVGAFSWGLRRFLRIGGAVGVASAANVFVGMVEAPLLIRPFMPQLTRSEMLVVMTGGMATVAGTVMILYAAILEPVIPGALGHILAASVISMPAAILISQVMIPESGQPTAADDFVPTHHASAMDAITTGTQQGIVLLVNVIAMLIVLVALTALVNYGLAAFPDIAGAPLTIQRVFGWLFAPLVWLIGIPWSEAQAAGALMGTKTVLNEFIAYVEMAGTGGATLSPHSRMIMLYAMCGFANFGSLGIMIGGLAAMAPARREEIVHLGLRSILAGTLATLMTGAVAGLI